MSAMCDSFRALQLKPHWLKGIYRYSQAMELLDRKHVSMVANNNNNVSPLGLKMTRLFTRRPDLNVN